MLRRRLEQKNKVIPPPIKLIPETEEWYTVSTKEKPIQGKANDSITKILADYFKTSQSNVKLISGSTSKRKIFEIK